MVEIAYIKHLRDYLIICGFSVACHPPSSRVEIYFSLYTRDSLVGEGEEVISKG